MNKIERIKELTEQLNHYRDSYYNNSVSVISDCKYDALYDELKKLEEETGIIMTNSPTHTVGYEVKSKLEKVKHSHPMLSLDKTKSVDDLVNFSNGKDCIISLKLDGLTILNTYDNHLLIQSETRGNGEDGEIVTHNARVFDNLPNNIPTDKKFEIEGEAIITQSDFEKVNVNGEYKNCRNLASGSVRQLDSNVTKDRHVRFIVWKIPFGFTTYTQGFDFAESCGFEVVPYEKYNSLKDNINEIIEKLKTVAKEKSLPIDGLVITYDNVEYGKSLGMTGHHPKHSLAFKFYEDEEETILINIEWQVGKTGVITPVSYFRPIELCGTTVEKASLHNISIIEKLQLGIGDTITVYKANEIIPQIRDNLTRSNTWQLPDKCPCCGGNVEVHNENGSKTLHCTNPDCDAKLLGKLVHFCSKNAINIEGMSEATLQFLIDKGWVNSFRDLFHLEKYRNEWLKCEGFGKRSVEKLLESIEKSRNTTLMKVLYAQSISLIGKSASKDIANGCNHDVQTFINFMNVYYDFTIIDGFGVEMQKSLSSWWKDNEESFYALIKEFTFEKVKEKNNNTDLSNKTFVITGSLTHYKNRDELVDLITSMGGKVSGSVSAKTNYLLNNDPNSTSSKNKKAKELGVPIITEEDFIKMIS